MHPGGSREEKMENMEICNISKVSKTVPNSVQTSSELVLRYFFEKKMASTHWRVETWKNSKKKRKKLKLSEMSRNVTNRVQTCYEVIFFEIIMPCRVEKWRKMKKKQTFEISKVSKNVPKSVQTCFELVLR